jgi:hypothetical protein
MDPSELWGCRRVGSVHPYQEYWLPPANRAVNAWWMTEGTHHYGSSTEEAYTSWASVSSSCLGSWTGLRGEPSLWYHGGKGL